MKEIDMDKYMEASKFVSKTNFMTKMCPISILMHFGT